MRRGTGWRDQWQSCQTTGGVDSCQPSHRGGIRIALDTDQLSRKEEGAARLELEGIAQQLGRIDKGVAMQAAVAQKLRLLKTGNHAKHPLLLPVGQFSLESHEVVTGAMGVFRPELYHSIGSLTRLGILKAHRLQRTELHSLAAPFGHHLDGDTTFEVGGLFEFFRLDFLSRKQRVIEGVIGRLVHRTVEIVIPTLVITGCEKYDIHIDGIGIHDRRDCIVKIQMRRMGQLRNRFRQFVGCQRAGCQDAETVRWDLGNLLMQNANVRMLFQRLGNLE